MNLSKHAIRALMLASLTAASGCGSGSSSSSGNGNSSEQPDPVDPAPVTPVTPGPNKAPVATNAALSASASGDLFIGTTLTIAYDYSDAENDASAGPVEVVWYRLDNDTATPEAIAGSNAASYVVTADDVDKYIRAVFKPSAATGTLTGDQVTTALSAQVSSNTAPSIQDLAIKTSCDAGEVTESRVGDSLVACYDYSDADNDLEDTDKTVFSWVEVNADSTETEIGTQAALTVPFSARNKTIKLSVTPYAQSGAPSGAAQKTEIKIDMEAIVFEHFVESNQIIFKESRLTDGSVEGTKSGLHSLGNNLPSSRGYTNLSKAAQLDDKLYYLMGAAGNAILTQVNLDGTGLGFVQNAGLAGASKPNELYKFNNKIVFSATRSGNGREMVVIRLIDGEPESTFIDVYFGSSSSNPSGFVYAPEIDTLFFTAIGSVNDEVIGRELYKITIPDTGEIPAPTLVKDIRESAYETNDFEGSEPKNLTWVNGRLYFSAWDGNTINQAGRTLWASDGSEAGTIKLDLGKTGDQYPTDFVAAGNSKIFFRSSSDEDATEGSLYVLVANNATELTGLNSLHGQVSFLTEFPANGSILYRATNTSSRLNSLWEMKPNGNSYNPVALTSIVNPLEKPLVKGNEIFFALRNSDGSYHIAKSALTDLNSPTSFVRSNNDMPRQLTLLNNRLIFVANGEEGKSRGIYYLDESSNVPQLLLNSNIGTSSEQYQPRIALPNSL